jgi:hypothetical protein
VSPECRTGGTTLADSPLGPPPKPKLVAGAVESEITMSTRRTLASAATWCSWSLAALADQACPAVGPAITQNSGPTGKAARSDS